jgi:hypothetical protein
MILHMKQPLQLLQIFLTFEHQAFSQFSIIHEPTISKRERFYRWALHYFFNFLLFGNVS